MAEEEWRDEIGTGTEGAMDLSSLSAGQIAGLTAGASLIGAVIAFVSSLTVAFVNARASRKNAVAVERRQYRIRRLEPLLKFAEQRMAESTCVHFFLSTKSWAEARIPLTAMAETSWMQLSSGLGIAFSDDELMDAFERFVGYEEGFRRHAAQLIRDQPQTLAGSSDYAAAKQARRYGCLR